MTAATALDSAAKVLLLEAFTAEELYHLASLRREEHRLPDPAARRMASELARIFSSPPLVMPDGTEIPNRPTIGFYVRLERRRADARRAEL